jgi:hypothetical protein
MTTYKMGTRILYGPTEYILARTVSPFSHGKFFFQLIALDTGNRLSNNVCVHNAEVDDISEIDHMELLYILEMTQEDFDQSRIKIIE